MFTNLKSRKIRNIDTRLYYINNLIDIIENNEKDANGEYVVAPEVRLALISNVYGKEYAAAKNGEIYFAGSEPNKPNGMLTLTTGGRNKRFMLHGNLEDNIKKLQTELNGVSDGKVFAKSEDINGHADNSVYDRVLETISRLAFDENRPPVIQTMLDEKGLKGVNVTIKSEQKVQGEFAEADGVYSEIFHDSVGIVDSLSTRQEEFRNQPPVNKTGKVKNYIIAGLIGALLVSAPLSGHLAKKRTAKAYEKDIKNNYMSNEYVNENYMNNSYVDRNFISKVDVGENFISKYELINYIQRGAPLDNYIDSYIKDNNYIKNDGLVKWDDVKDQYISKDALVDYIKKGGDLDKYIDENGYVKWDEIKADYVSIDDLKNYIQKGEPLDNYIKNHIDENGYVKWDEVKDQYINKEELEKYIAKTEIENIISAYIDDNGYVKMEDIKGSYLSAGSKTVIYDILVDNFGQSLEELQSLSDEDLMTRLVSMFGKAPDQGTFGPDSGSVNNKEDNNTPAPTGPSSGNEGNFDKGDSSNVGTKEDDYDREMTTEPTQPTTDPTQPTTNPTEGKNPGDSSNVGTKEDDYNRGETTDSTRPTDPTQPTTNPTQPTDPTQPIYDDGGIWGPGSDAIGGDRDEPENEAGENVPTRE